MLTPSSVAARLMSSSLVAFLAACALVALKISPTAADTTCFIQTVVDNDTGNVLVHGRARAHFDEETVYVWVWISDSHYGFLASAGPEDTLVNVESTRWYPNGTHTAHVEGYSEQGRCYDSKEFTVSVP